MSKSITNTILFGSAISAVAVMAALAFAPGKSSWSPDGASVAMIEPASGAPAAPGAAADDTAAAAPASGASRAEFEGYIRDYLMSHPEVIMQSVEQYRMKQMEEAQKQAEAKVGQYKSQLTAERHPVAGNPQGDVTIIEFFDYNCGYCKQALSGVRSLIQEDKNLKFVFIELPILSPQSEVSARWALAASRQDMAKYFEFHSAMMEHKGPMSEADMRNAAGKVGLDVTKLAQDAESAEVKAEIESNHKIATDIGINGTPAFIIGDKLVRGFADPAQMKQMIADARAQGKPADAPAAPAPAAEKAN